MKKTTEKKESIDIILKGHDLGEVNFIAEKLAEKTSVTFAASNYTHPLKGEPVLYAKGKNIQKEAQAAIEEAREDIKTFKAKLDKSL